ncbi:hypothetical protein C8J57DRAFT_1277717 [Mycena rebaudengoi]|nr:hypothetical protein C8J57DRAFT_1277717 [Mycena rebaudengoi]
MDPLSCVPNLLSDPDIAGIGVRAAIYIQNLISFIPAIWALWDGNVSLYELDSVQEQSLTILITAFAILISAMVQKQTLGLSNFHTSVILSLSWMNNTNAFIYFLLYVQHKSQPQEGNNYIPMDISSWVKHLRQRLSGILSLTPDVDDSKTHTTEDVEGQERSGTRLPRSPQYSVLSDDSSSSSVRCIYPLWQPSVFGSGVTLVHLGMATPARLIWPRPPSSVLVCPCGPVDCGRGPLRYIRFS